MSWDVFIMRFPVECQDMSDIPPDWVPEDIGTVGEVRAAIEAVVPGFTWGSDGWGRGEGDGFSVAVCEPDDDDAATNGVTLMFRGGGDAALVAMAVADRLNARALGGGEFLTPENAGVQLAEWERFRARALGSDGGPA